MSTSTPTLDFTPTSFTRWISRIARAHRLTSLNLNLTGEVENLHRGHIFLFNHFTRFETAVPPYLIHKHTGALCRSVAHHSLFAAHPRISRALQHGGAIPSNHPNLLPLLAAEILRGRKVIIFPEGGLVKDKRVMGEHGDYGMFSGASGMVRKHHRGAAVLAVYLDVLKFHLRSILAGGNAAHITHWLTELDIPTAEALQAAVAQPTLIVPNTITFFPIRSEGNTLTSLLAKTVGTLPDFLTDEVTTESNLLFRPTDMDVVVRPALTTTIGTRRSENLLWRPTLRHAQTVADVFALADNNQHLLAPLVQRTLANAITRLRDGTMHALYGGLTVNLHHVIAQVVHTYQLRGRTTVPANQFHHAVFFALHRLQLMAASNPHLILHHGVTNPHTAHHTLLGHGHRFTRFMDMLRRTHLVKRKTEGSGTAATDVYHLSHRLSDLTSMDDVRLEHPIHLHVNEAAPQPAVRLACAWAVAQATGAPSRTLTTALLTHMGATLTSPTTNNSGHGVLLIHGLSAAPAQMAGLAAHLTSLGHTTLAIRLPGHGSTPAALHGVTHQHWVAEAQRGLLALQGLGLTTISAVGFSTGALVALRLAQIAPNALTAVVAAAPPVQLVSRLRHLLRPALLLNNLTSYLPFFTRLFPHGLIPWYATHTQEPTYCYTHLPLASVRELQLLAKAVTKRATRLTTPTLVLQGTADSTAAPAATAHLASLIPHAQLHTLAGAGHLILTHNTLGSWSTLATFLTQKLKEHPHA